MYIYALSKCQMSADMVHEVAGPLLSLFSALPPSATPSSLLSLFPPPPPPATEAGAATTNHFTTHVSVCWPRHMRRVAARLPYKKSHLCLLIVYC